MPVCNGAANPPECVFIVWQERMTCMKKALLFCLTALLLAACNLTPEAAPSANATTPPESVTSSGSPVPAGDLTQTHTDSLMGISFHYPAGWIIDGSNPPGDMIQLYSPTAMTPQPKQGEGYSDDQTKIEFVKLPAGSPYSTIDGYIEFYQEGGDSTSGTLEVVNRMTLGGDIPAARLQFTGAMAGNVPVVILELNGALVSVAGYGDVSRFDEVLGTLRRAGA
jgi:hypothetical protein